MMHFHCIDLLAVRIIIERETKRDIKRVDYYCISGESYFWGENGIFLLGQGELFFTAAILLVV